MQEFESISASSYDPSALATKLTAKAAEGWSVVAIVPTSPGSVAAGQCEVAVAWLRRLVVVVHDGSTRWL